MSKCEKTDVCTFFTNKMSRLPTAAERFRFKVDYCIKDKMSCARYMVNQKLYGGCAPANDEAMFNIDSRMRKMFPNDVDMAQEIIRELCAG
jgi:hypothetical protein